MEISFRIEVMFPTGGKTEWLVFGWTGKTDLIVQAMGAVGYIRALSPLGSQVSLKEIN